MTTSPSPSPRYWKFIIIFVVYVFISLSEASRNLKKPIPSDSAVVVVGTVFCDTCFHQDFSKASHFIPGASVEIECSRGTGAAGVFKQAVKTNERGEFKVKLPTSMNENEKSIEGCSVKLIRSSEPYCNVGSKVVSSTLHLKSKKQRTHVFSAGFFTFRPLKQPEVCDQKPSFFHNGDNKFSISNPELPTLPIQDPPKSSDLPPLPSTGGGQGIIPPIPRIPDIPPLPQIPPLPNIPGVAPPLPKVPPLPNIPGGAPLLPPIPPKTIPSSSLLPMKTVSSQNPQDFIPFFPPLPLLPPPSIFPPIPLLPPPSALPPVLPSPPASLFPPILPSPPASLFPPILPTPPSLPPILPLPVSPPTPPPGIIPPVFPLPGTPPTPPPGIIPPVIPLPGTPPSLPLPPLIPGVPPQRPPVSTPSLPPFPFQPTPGFPGVPPATTVSATNANPSKENTP